MAGRSDDQPPPPDGQRPVVGPGEARPAAAEPARFLEPGVPARGEQPAQDARWTSLAGWADVTPTGLRLEDLDPDVTPRGGLRLAPLTPVPPAASVPPAALAPPGALAPPAALVPPHVPPPQPAHAPRPQPTARTLPASSATPAASGPSTSSARWLPAGPAPSPWPAPPPTAVGAPAGPGTRGVPAAPFGAAWQPGAGPSPAMPISRRRPVLTAALVSLVLLVVATGIAWFALTPVCCADDAAAPSVAAIPTAVPTAASPAPGTDSGWTSAQRALSYRLDSARLVACRPNPSPAGAGVAAALYCATPQGRQVAVYGYRDADALRSDVAERANGVPTDGSCENGDNEVFRWGAGPGVAPAVQGTAICHHRDGKAFLFWSSDAELTAFLAYDTDSGALFGWWTSFAPFPNRSGLAGTSRRA